MSVGRYFIGVMSGTSVDAADAVVVDFDSADGGALRLLAASSKAWPAGLRAELLTLGAGCEHEMDRAGEADRQVAGHFAEVIHDALRQAGLRQEDIRAIGSHGQTIRHRPNAAHPFTLQIGDPSTLAELTGISVVADFRRRDIAAGGQGAPLVPAFHQALFAEKGQTVAVLNLGGIANITMLMPDRPAMGYDTGPANMLLDGWCLRHTGCDYDASGAWAASGDINSNLLAEMLAHPYFQRSAPKSTGREEFGMAWLDGLLASRPSLATADVQATLTELTALSVAREITRQAGQGRVLVCGGGVRNSFLLQRLAAALPGWQLDSTSVRGLDPLWVEACAFAWLARQTVLGLTGNLPAVTGARGTRVLGAYYPAGEGLVLP